MASNAPSRPASSVYTMRSYSSTFLSRKSDGDKDNEPVKVIRTGRGGRGNIRKQKPKARALGVQNSLSIMSFASSSTATSSTTQSSFSSLATPSDRSSIISISARHKDATSVKSFKTSALSTSDGSDMEDAPRHTGADPPSTLLSVVPRSVHSLILRIPSSSSSRSVSPHPDSPVDQAYPQPYEGFPNEEIPETEYATTLGRDCSAVFQGPQTRIGRGGPGSFKKIISALEPGAYKGPEHPGTSAIVEQEENRRVILERNLLEHSLVEGMLLYSSGRGGTGNITDQRKLENQRRSRIVIRRKKNRDSTSSTSSKSSTSSTSEENTTSAPSSPASSRTARRHSLSPTRPSPTSPEGPVTPDATEKVKRKGFKRLFRRTKGKKRVDAEISPQEESVSEAVISIGFEESPTDIREEDERSVRRFIIPIPIDTSDATIRTPQISPKLPPTVPLPETPSSASSYGDDNTHEYIAGGEVFEVIIEEEEEEEQTSAVETRPSELFADDEGENDDDVITPMDELNDREFLDVILSTFPTEFPGDRDAYDDEDGVGVADYDPELHDLQQRSSALSMQEARQEVLSDSEKEVKTLTHSRTRAKSLSSLISNSAQNVAVQDLRRPLPPIPVVRISQHN
ncbi:hypothetical protein SCHPADRAFT_905285 [Schizopora paradoxa]|uniref:Uncharacterized protein n=1 Tax=Schizopora paradoxa TaxID=27342 RepID=A0A0H2RKV8_9AGAM|nr:hypothetical protein SCHPADRAFT_905285 [Schizopora paradoxa]